ncbi:MAG: GH36-type glycosyl hydrolase domain-containing protein, partial [Spirochaetia bacterium]
AKGRCGNSIAQGWAPVASHQIELNLQPGEETQLVFTIGYAENSKENKWKEGEVNTEGADSVISYFNNTENAWREFDLLRGHWEKQLSGFRIESDNEKLNRMMNTWNQYQCMTTFQMARSASFFESGISRGIGFRDTNQDMLGILHIAPEAARQRILDIASIMLSDGGAYHQYQFLTKEGNDEVGSQFNDDPLWLIMAASAYLKETGDYSILDEYIGFGDSDEKTDLFDHLYRGFQKTAENTGDHGLPLIGRADWNDCLNLNCFSQEPDESFQTVTNKDGKKAESVFIAGMFCLIAPDFRYICEKKGFYEIAAYSERKRAAIEKAVMEFGWDGEWYLRAYDDAGSPIGTKNAESAKIFSESQGICTMAGIGRSIGCPQKALSSVESYLETEHGIVLIWPAFSSYKPEFGEISSYPPGYKENGGVFCHNNPWIAIGEAGCGNGERAFEVYSKITPAWFEEQSNLHKVEPYVYCQMISGKEAPVPGEGKNSWLTGTAAWSFIAASQYILGVRPDYEGLIIDPCIPKSWEGFTVYRRFRGSDYTIHVRNPERVSSGVVLLKIDGCEIQGNTVPAFTDGKEHTVEVVLGKQGKRSVL